MATHPAHCLPEIRESCVLKEAVQEHSAVSAMPQNELRAQVHSGLEEMQSSHLLSAGGESFCDGCVDTRLSSSVPDELISSQLEPGAATATMLWVWGSHCRHVVGTRKPQLPCCGHRETAAAMLRAWGSHCRHVVGAQQTLLSHRGHGATAAAMLWVQGRHCCHDVGMGQCSAVLRKE